MQKFRFLVFAGTLLLFLPSAFGADGVEAVRDKTTKLWKEAYEQEPSVTVAEVHRAMEAKENFVLVDVRDTEEFKLGHLPGAINLTRGLLEFQAPGQLTDPDQKLFIYCRTGARSALATRMLRSVGYTNAVNLEGGFKAWMEAGYPIFNKHGKFTLVAGGFEEEE